MNRREKAIIFLDPVFKQMIWGGERLGTDWPYKIPGPGTGECWAVSAHPNGDCIVREGTHAGKSLSQLWEEEPALFGNFENAGNPKLDRFPLLTKIIDAKSDLSIQVHPDDAYAKAHENGSLGKTECWYILECGKNASLVIGHNAKDKEELTAMTRECRWKEFIREIPVKRGDFIQIDPGTVHAIKGGIMLLETQQNSDITYRVYDYDRLSDGKPRQLHVEQSIDVITVPAKAAADCIKDASDLPKDKMNLLISCPYYKVWKIDVADGFSFLQEWPFLIMSVITGEGEINGQTIRKGDHFILSCRYGEAVLKGRMEIIAASI